MAAQSNHPLAIHCLLDHNANINLRGQLHQTLLAYAVEYNAHHALEALLQRGAAYNVRPTEQSPTIAHFAAKFADARTLEILGGWFKDGDFEMEELEGEDADGRTLRELVTVRLREGGGVEMGVGQAFRAMVERMVPGGLGGASEDEEAEAEVEMETETEVWEDALERLQSGSGDEDEMIGRHET